MPGKNCCSNPDIETTDVPFGDTFVNYAGECRNCGFSWVQTDNGPVFSDSADNKPDEGQHDGN